MKCTALLPVMFLCGCMTTTFTETTEITRPTGETVVRMWDKPGREELLEFRTPREVDGFEFFRNVLTDEVGSARITLLPAALQCLVYRHTVKLTVLSVSENREIHAETIGAEGARQIVEEWRVQAKLGATVPLRRTEKGLMERAIAELADAPLVEALQEMLPKVEDVPDWR